MLVSNAQIAQSVEQRTENPRVDSSILSLGTIFKRLVYFKQVFFFALSLDGQISQRALGHSCSIQAFKNWAEKASEKFNRKRCHLAGLDGYHLTKQQHNLNNAGY